MYVDDEQRDDDYFAERGPVIIPLDGGENAL